MFDVGICERDLGYIIDGAVIDILNGVDAKSNQSMLVLDITVQQWSESNQPTEFRNTSQAIGYAKQVINLVLQNPNCYTQHSNCCNTTI